MSERSGSGGRDRHAVSGALLLLSDGRLPSGGYAHSGGLEASVRRGRVRSAADLESFLRGVATTAGLIAASFAAAACRIAAGFLPVDGRAAPSPTAPDLAARLDRLEAEFLARTPSPTQREVSTALGRQLLRALRTVAPHELLDRIPDRPCHPIALGVGATTLGLEPVDAARAMLHETLMAPTIAATKLLSIDPFDAHRAFAANLALTDDLTEIAARRAEGDPADLPSPSAPLLEVLAEHHAVARTRLFAS